eukprot:TRINITY_DN24628_c0_g1_i1.p1 TRINITY_DN24628_c0_g1~~TRINITY_DN24628_c0_g1_i1.p1  ORF type:complete len:667 (+),score=33.42 TRINITY_DN24628_c0_g1_i1:118-2118(+)
MPTVDLPPAAARCGRPQGGMKQGPRYAAPAVVHVRQGQEWQQMLDSVSPGDHVVVEGGRYTLPCVVRQPDIVISAAPGAEVVLHCKAAACLTFCSPHWAKLEGVTLRNDSGYGVLVQRSAPELVNCIITGAQGGVLVTRNFDNRALLPVLKRCSIIGSARGPGVTLRDSQAIVEGCTISNNCDAGVLATGVSTPWLQGNSFCDGRGAGIALSNRCRGVLRENKIERNACAGVLLSGGSDPVVWKNEVADNAAEGVRIDSGCKGLIELNTFHGNRECSALVSGASEPVVRWNAVRGGGGREAAGIVVDGASPKILQNTFHSVGGVCLQLSGDGRPHVFENYFSTRSESQPAVVVGPHCQSSIIRNHVVLPRGSQIDKKSPPNLIHVAVARAVSVEDTVYTVLDRRCPDVHDSCPESFGCVDGSAFVCEDAFQVPRMIVSETLSTPGRARRRSSIADRIDSIDAQRRRSEALLLMQSDSAVDELRRQSDASLAGVVLTLGEDSPTPLLTPQNDVLAPPPALRSPSADAEPLPPPHPTPGPIGAVVPLPASAKPRRRRSSGSGSERRGSVTSSTGPRGRRRQNSASALRAAVSAGRTLRRSTLPTQPPPPAGHPDEEAASPASVRRELEALRRVLTPSEELAELKLLRSWVDPRRLAAAVMLARSSERS